MLTPENVKIRLKKFSRDRKVITNAIRAGREDIEAYMEAYNRLSQEEKACLDELMLIWMTWVPNLGELGALELMGRLGVFLVAKVGDKERRSGVLQRAQNSTGQER